MTLLGDVRLGHRSSSYWPATSQIIHREGWFGKALGRGAACERRSSRWFGVTIQFA